MNTNWRTLTLWQHIKRCTYLWFLLPFTLNFWKVILFDDGKWGGIGYALFAICFMFTIYGVCLVTSPIAFPLTTIISRIVAQKRARKAVIKALRSK